MRAVVMLIALLVAMLAHAQMDLWDQRARTPGLIWGSKIVIEDQPCCETAKGTPTDDSAEATVLAAEPRRAFRDGRVLKLNLMGGRSLKITDCDQEACNPVEYRRHRLVAWWTLPGFRYYVVNVHLYEGGMTYLIREADGLVVVVAAPPVLSPSSRYAIAWNRSLMDGPSMELLDLNSYPPTMHDITPGRMFRSKREYLPRGEARMAERHAAHIRRLRVFRFELSSIQNDTANRG